MERLDEAGFQLSCSMPFIVCLVLFIFPSRLQVVARRSDYRRDAVTPFASPPLAIKSTVSQISDGCDGSMLYLLAML